MRMYENQREKLEKQIELLEAQLDKINAKSVQLESQNFALQKGLSLSTLYPKDSEVGSYLDQVAQ